MKKIAAPLSVIAVCLLLGQVFAAEPIDGRSASRWRPELHWAPGREPGSSAVKDDNGWLEFSLTGANSLMTWTLEPSPEEMKNEPRYLVFIYRAENLKKEGSSYLLLMRDGSPGWRQLLNGEDLEADGKEHTVAIDILSYSPPAPIHQFAFRIGPPADGRGRMLMKIQFTNDPPAGVEPRTALPAESKKMRIDFEDIKWNPSPNWTPRPPDRHDMQKTEKAVRFSMVGQQKSMRWSAAVPKGLDIGKMPFVSLRYRAKGKFGPWGYAFYMSAVDDKGKKASTYVMKPGDVDGDDHWHVFHAKLDEKGIGGTMAVGIDCLSPEAEIEMDYIEYSSLPPKTPIDEMLTFEKREATWPKGKDGLSTLPVSSDGLVPNHFMIPRMGIGSWFDTPHITAEGIPFEVPTDPSAMLASGTVGEDDLAVDLPPDTKEVLLLIAAAFPYGEKFGANWRRPTPLRILNEPERLTIQLIYADGTSEHMLPIHVVKSEYGVGHDIAVYAVHPAPGRAPSRLVFHDNMRNACFGLLGVTANAGQPRFREPDIQTIWYPPVKKPAMADATIEFQTENGLTWDKIESAMLGGAVDLAGRSVFHLTLQDGEQKKEIPSAKWTVKNVERNGKSLKATVTYAEGDVSLRAVFEAKQDGPNGAMLALDLSNTGKKPVTGALLFPFVDGLKIGSLKDTWYFCGRRGGVINRVPCYWRDEIGEGHPIQVDGFFNPKIGAGISFMPRDMEGVFRYYRVEKDDAGCGYCLEFLPQTVKPGGKWMSIPVLAAVIPGDWKDQFSTYQAWVKTWYRPLVPRKDWFRKVFAFCPGSPTARMAEPVEKRIDFVAKAEELKKAIGACDYMHLFGWAKTEKYGHWGDYDHYDAVGGRERFVKQVRRCQDAGTPVGLYLDGYLVSTKSIKPTMEQRKRWAIRTAKGEMLYHKSYDAHSMCPYVSAWRDYLANVYKRVAAEVKPNGMYIDEFGRCMPHRTCYSKEHGHPSPMGMAPGERILIRQIREAAPPEIATYTEYIPSDVTCRYLDGGFGHVSLYGWRKGYDDVAPHYVDLHRFAFPDFKSFELIYYVPGKNGNYYLLRYPFFNGNGYYLTGACLTSDEHTQAFYKNVFRVQHEHVDAFTSEDVEPLVRTETPNLFANRFSTSRKTVWTLFNANYRTLRGKLMVVPHREGTNYFDSWNNRPVEATIKGGMAELSFEIGPRQVGCIVQK
ncbi:MAG: hypothetical protein GXP25_08055 [Planctomycetes bacterium]|nr:hypothetical protein [Planctomycetota bacterium]